MKIVNLAKVALVGFCITSLQSHAQDVHFSHVEFSPLTLNPAMAGAESPMQAIVNYRNQWNSVAVPYSTIAASFDARFNDKKRMKKGIMAGGLNFFNDRAGDVRVSTTNINLNLAYHLILDETSTLGIGLSTAYGQRSIDPSAGRWGSQYDGMAYNSGLASGETFNNPSFGYVDVGAGMVYCFKQGQGYTTQNNNKAFTWGMAFYHLNRPKFSYIEQEQERLFMRFSTFINANFGIKNTRGSVLPGIYYNRQKKSNEFFYGMYYKYILTEGSKVTGFNKPLSMYIGLFHRWNDAMVAKFMLEFDQYSAGFAYDVNVSSLTEVSRARGGFEVFLRFNMNNGPKGWR
ncbi:MAG: PorP/SprF family type IX secretion system membrane protein [Bacteroidota bacterium]